MSRGVTTWTIVRAEYVVLLRNRTAFSSTVLIPVTLCVALFFVNTPPQLVGPLLVLQVALLLGLSAYVSTVVMLAARREALYLKRLRTTVATDGQIITAITLPFVMTAVLQVVAVVVTGAAVSDEAPRIGLVVLGCALVLAQLLALAFSTAGLSRSAEQAQLVASPAFLYLSGVAVWILTEQSATVHLVQKVIPLGGALSIVADAYRTSDSGDVALAGLTSVLWTIVLVGVGRLTFRWEPRSSGGSGFGRRSRVSRRSEVGAQGE